MVEALDDEINDPLDVAAALCRLRNVLAPRTRDIRDWYKIVEAEAFVSGGVTAMLRLTHPLP